MVFCFSRVYPPPCEAFILPPRRLFFPELISAPRFPRARNSSCIPFAFCRWVPVKPPLFKPLSVWANQFNFQLCRFYLRFGGVPDTRGRSPTPFGADGGVFFPRSVSTFFVFSRSCPKDSPPPPPAIPSSPPKVWLSCLCRVFFFPVCVCNPRLWPLGSRGELVRMVFPPCFFPGRWSVFHRCAPSLSFSPFAPPPQFVLVLFFFPFLVSSVRWRHFVVSNFPDVSLKSGDPPFVANWSWQLPRSLAGCFLSALVALVGICPFLSGVPPVPLF